MADKTVSIKNATDAQLDELIMRLSKERQAQSLIADLKRGSSKPEDIISYDRPEVSTEMPVSSLYHFGVVGMRWGKRHQNPDGSLTDSGKKKLSKVYKKEMVKVLTETNKASQIRKRNMDAYTETAKEYNNGKTEKFNKKHKSTSPTYKEDYMRQFNKDMATKYNKMLLKDVVENKHYKKAKTLVDKYGMTSFDKLAKDNEELFSEVSNGKLPKQPKQE